MRSKERLTAKQQRALAAVPARMRSNPTVRALLKMGLPVTKAAFLNLNSSSESEADPELLAEADQLPER